MKLMQKWASFIAKSRVRGALSSLSVERGRRGRRRRRGRRGRRWRRGRRGRREGGEERKGGGGRAER